MCDAAANGRRPRRSSAATGWPPAQRHCERSDAIQSRRSLSCHRPRKRTIQYSRDAGDDIDRPRRTGSPAFAEDDSGGRGGATGLEPWPGKPATATTALGPKISKTTPCTVARKAHWRSLACAIPPRHLTRSGKSRVLFDNSEIGKNADELGLQRRGDRTYDSPAATPPVVSHFAPARANHVDPAQEFVLTRSRSSCRSRPRRCGR